MNPSQFSHFGAAHQNDLENVALAVRALGMDAVLKSKSGHVGLPLGGAEMGTLLYFAAMNYSPQNPHWLDRDRFVLSAGHGSMLQYALLHLAEFPLSLLEIENFRQWGSLTPGHPEYGHTVGVEVTTGPLGQGIANAVGMALAERMLADRFSTASATLKTSGGTPLIDHHTYVILGDGCMMEGVSGGASSLAGHLKLSKLVAFYDANNITIDGTIDISFTENVKARYAAFGWNVLEADGNSFPSLATALDLAHANSAKPAGTAGPTLVVCKGIAGKGSPKWEGKPKIHGNPMSAEDVIDAKKHLGIENTTPFTYPDKCTASAKKLLATRTAKEQTWQQNFEKTLAQWKNSQPELVEAWKSHFETQNADVVFSESAWTSAAGKMATRAAGGKALTELAKTDKRLVGGSADLAGSNNTTLAESSFVSAENFSGRNIHFGVREHAMGAITNGLALHGGLRPYCATFAVFSDYMRPPIRLAALMKLPSIFIFTHDSYAVGEDGPTHQPIEQVAALRAIPNLNVLRPADALETYAAWQTALQSSDRPTALLLTRQDVPDLDTELKSPRVREEVIESMTTGASLLKDFDNTSAAQKLIFIASGSEVAPALRAAKLLEATTLYTLKGESVRLNVRVVSAPAPQLLSENPVVLNRLVPANVPAVAVEAGSPQGWGEIVGRSGAIFALKHFGASAPADTLTKQFGFTPENLALFAANYLHIRFA